MLFDVDTESDSLTERDIDTPFNKSSAIALLTLADSDADLEASCSLNSF